MYQFIPREELRSVLDIADFSEHDRAEIAYRHFVDGAQEAMYVEENGVLLGIVSIGDLERYYGNRQDSLEPNRRFSYTDKINEEKVSAFFAGFKTFSEFPVVDCHGRLEGVMKRDIRYDTRQDQLASLVVSRYLKEQWHKRELNRFLANTGAKVVLYYINQAKLTKGSGEGRSAPSEGAGGEIFWKGLSQKQWDDFLGEAGAVTSLKKEFGNFHTEMVKGVSEIVAMEGDFYHCVDGNRITPENPPDPQSRILFYGPCTVFGAYCRDAQTIPSCLQRMLNAKAGQPVRVINRGLFNVANFFSRMMTDELGEKDIAVIYVEKRWLTEEMSRKCCYIGDLTDTFLQIENLENNILDSPEHCNYRVNACLAERICHDLEGHRLLDASGLSKERKRIQDYYIGSELMSEVLLYMERHNLLQEDAAVSRGAMALLADPFTGRHRKAVESALRKVDRLFLFLSEDSNLEFSLKERMRMATDALKDFGNRVVVVPAGKYLFSKKISRGIRKQRFCDNDMEYDCDIFGEIFGGLMGIRYRFVMSELENPVERKYMDTCMDILPRFGVATVEL